MDINFEYYKIFYYVAKYCNFTKSCEGTWKQPAECNPRHEQLEQQINSILLSEITEVCSSHRRESV